MEDSALTRLAVEEIVREMHEAKMTGQEPAHLRERKRNPLGKTNTRFLGRTLNSIITHNKREKDRTHENCKRKLKELASEQRRKLGKQRSSRRGSKKKELIRSRSESFDDTSTSTKSNSKSKSSSRSSSGSSSTSLDKSIAADKTSKQKKKKKMSKKSRGRSRNRSRSRSSSRSRSRSSNGSGSIRSESKRGKYRYREFTKDQHDGRYFDAEEADEDEWVEPQSSNSLGMVAAAYNHINQFLQYQSLQTGLNAEELEGELKHITDDFEATELADIKNCIIKTESMSLSSTQSVSNSSTSSISVHSGDEVDENGVLTINLSSEDNSLRSNTNHLRKKGRCEEMVASISCDSSSSGEEEQNAIWGSCISLDSSAAGSTHSKPESDGSVAILSSASEEATKLSNEEKRIEDQVTVLEESIVPVANNSIDLTSE